MSPLSLPVSGGLGSGFAGMTRHRRRQRRHWRRAGRKPAASRGVLSGFEAYGGRLHRRCDVGGGRCVRRGIRGGVGSGNSPYWRCPPGRNARTGRRLGITAFSSSAKGEGRPPLRAMGGRGGLRFGQPRQEPKFWMPKAKRSREMLVRHGSKPWTLLHPVPFSWNFPGSAGGAAQTGGPELAGSAKPACVGAQHPGHLAENPRRGESGIWHEAATKVRQTKTRIFA